MPIFRDYLRNLREIRGSGQAVPETSYYGTLKTLLNDLGKSLKPRVRSVINLRNRGAGIPDGGLFTEEQFAASGDNPFGAGQLPSRGVLEIKSTAEAVEKTAQSAQVAKYLAHYGLVLVTNYRDFLLVETDANGQATPLERYTIADETAFWSEDIGSLVDAHSERLKDFLRRVMSYRAPLKNPKDLAWFLASYAREALSRLETSASLGREVAGLLETETPVVGVTSGKVREELRGIGSVSAAAGQRLDSEKDLVLTAGWGHFGARNAVMPGKGRTVARDYTPEELAGFGAGATSLGVSVEELLDLLGTTTYDVYLNDKAYWKNVPSRVWDYTIGGYQVIKKWLSYREAGVLGRSLEVSEARHVTETARRIAGLLVLEPRLNENYQAVKAGAYEWPT